MDPSSVAPWASFLIEVQNDPAMKVIHERTYGDFRDRLQALIAAALDEAGHPTEPGRLRHLAIACNAVIDGLWLEGSALPDAFDVDELPEIGLTSVGAIVGLELTRSS